MFLIDLWWEIQNMHYYYYFLKNYHQTRFGLFVASPE